MKTLIDNIRTEVQAHFANDTSGHDWFHIERVEKMAVYIHSFEGGDLEVIQLAALLHDISDHKLNGGILNDGARASKVILTKHGASEEISRKVCDIIDRVSFKGAKVDDVMPSLEGKIVQDADRLDAIGAIGIARAFSYGGSRNRPMYVPNQAPVTYNDFESYVKSEGHTINHFYEKLLLLKDRLHTLTAKKIGNERHVFMQTFLKEFYKEWESKIDENV
jgi:uncharacterized protein